jgi:hypothetical protein
LEEESEKKERKKKIDLRVEIYINEKHKKKN